jgi:hypothetical protein
VFIFVVSEFTSRNSSFCLADDSLRANKRSTQLLPSFDNIQDNLAPFSSQLTPRKDKYPYQPESNPSAGIEDIANDPINTPFPFLPLIRTFGFPSLWQPLPGAGNNGNYRLLVNRDARLPCPLPPHVQSRSDRQQVTE